MINSMRFKLLLAFSIILTAGFITTWLILSRYESHKLTEEIVNRLHIEAIESAEGILRNLDELKKELLFLSTLDVMDDIIAHDVDIRIESYLKKRADDLGNGIEFVLFDAGGNEILETSRKNIGPDSSSLFNAVTDGKSFFNGFYIISTQVHASFDKNLNIGRLVMLIPLQYFKSGLHETGDKYAWLLPPANSDNITKNIFSAPDEKLDEMIYASIPLASPLYGWKLIYAVKKDNALQTVYFAKNIIFATFIIMALLMGLLTLMVEKQLLTPVRDLSRFVKKIIQTNNYRLKPPIPSNDEVGDLSKSFAVLMDRTDKALTKIEEQNLRHMRTLEALMTFLEEMAAAKSVDEAIETATKRIRLMAGSKEVSISESANRKEGSLSIRILYEKREVPVYKYINVREINDTLAMTDRVYESIGRIVSAQIERLYLLKSKTSFFSGLSHELKTPLGSILTLAQLLIGSGKCGEKEMESLARIEHSAQYLLHIINDILMLAKADAGEIKPHIQKCDIRSLIGECVEIIEPLAEAKNLSLETLFCAQCKNMSTDPKLLRMVIINFLANSVKFTQKGFIKVCVSKHGGDLRIEIKDSGIGISKENLDKLFDEFFREYREDSSEHGTGIGLALSKKIVEILGGRLKIFSEGEGKGASATITLPL